VIADEKRAAVERARDEFEGRKAGLGRLQIDMR
jgi:hypothetical protein